MSSGRVHMPVLLILHMAEHRSMNEPSQERKNQLADLRTHEQY